MKKITFVTLILIMVMALSMSAFAADNNKPVVFEGFHLVVNGEEKAFEEGNPPLVMNGRTMLPLDYMFRLVNTDGTGTIGWDGVEKKVTLTYKDTEIELWINNPEALINGEKVSVGEASPVIYNSRTYVPMAFVGKSFDMSVAWEASVKTAALLENSKLTEIKELMAKVNKDMEDTKMAMDLSADVAMDMTMGEEAQSVKTTMEMSMEFDLPEKFQHAVIKTEVGGIAQEVEMYDDGTNTYTIVGTEITKGESTLSLLDNMGMMKDTEYTDQQLCFLGITTDKDGNKVISGDMYLGDILDEAMPMIDDMLGAASEENIDVKINGITPANIAYVLDKDNNIVSMEMAFGIDMGMTVQDQGINIKADYNIAIDKITLNAKFDTVVPAKIKNSAVSAK